MAEPIVLMKNKTSVGAELPEKLAGFVKSFHFVISGGTPTVDVEVSNDPNALTDPNNVDWQLLLSKTSSGIFSSSWGYFAWRANYKSGTGTASVYAAVDE